MKVKIPGPTMEKIISSRSLISPIRIQTRSLSYLKVLNLEVSILHTDYNTGLCLTSRGYQPQSHKISFQNIPASKKHVMIEKKTTGKMVSATKCILDMSCSTEKYVSLRHRQLNQSADIRVEARNVNVKFVNVC